jgi:hypothetical protein
VLHREREDVDQLLADVPQDMGADDAIRLFEVDPVRATAGAAS